VKVVFLILLLLLPSWVYAADGDSFDLPYAEFVKVDDETMKVFREASCNTGERTYICHFLSNLVLFGSFTGANRTEAIVLSGIPMDCPCTSIGELFGFIDNSWQQLGPFENDSYSFMIGNECHKISPSGVHELLLCADDFADSYEEFFVDLEFFPTYTLRLIDLSKVPVVTILFSTRDVGGNSLFCRDLQPNEAFKLLEDIQMTFDDFDNDMNLDVSLNLRETEINSSNCALGGIEDAVMKLDGKPPIRHQLTWLFDGETFMPTPETKAFLESLINQ
jgi:hypothetical protein